MIAKNTVREHRLRQKLTQLQLAAKANIHTTVISNIENYRVNPYPAWRERLAEALGVEEDILFP